ncbi:MAG: PAS domain S-box protein [Acidobacteriota bacterium]|nr:PAS domain S-box protein [Acidobacteriota bacterium]
MNREKKRLTKKSIAADIDDTAQKTSNLDGLRESEAKYRGFIENLPVMFYAVEPHPPYSPIYINPAFEQFGYPLEEWRENLDLWMRVLHSEDRDWVLKKTEAAMRAGEKTNYEYRIVAKNGDVHWVRDRGSFVRDESGNAICWQGIIIDITERKLDEQKLQRSEKLYRTLAHNIPHTSVLLFDHDFRYTLAEGINFDKHEHSKEPFEGKTLWEIFPPEISEEWSGYYRRALGGETVSLEKETAKGYFQAYVLPVKNESGEIFAGMVMWQDISTLKAAEQELRALFEAMTDVIIVLDINGRYLKIAPTNPSLLYRSPEELIGKTLADTFPPEQAAVFHDFVLAALKTKQTHRFEYMLPIAGREVWFAATISPMTADTIIWVARDITERREAEEALRQSEAQFKSSFEDAAVGMAISSMDGCWMQVNQALCQTLGYKKEELINRRFADFTHPDDVQEVFEAIRSFKSGKISVHQREKRYIHKKGHTVWAYLNVSMVRPRDGKPSHFIAEIQDITERKWAQDALEATNNLLNGLIEGTPDTVFVKNLDGRYLMMNSAGAGFLGKTPEEFIGRTDAEIYPVETAKQFAEADRQVTDSGETRTFEGIATAADGSLHTYLVTKAAYRNQPGEIIGLIGISHDITERKRAEEALKDSEERYRNLFENANDLIYVRDVEGNYLSINKATERVLGYTREEALKINAQQIVVPEHMDRVRKMYADEIAGASQTAHEFDCITKQGKKVTLEINSSAIYKNGVPVAVQGIARDITERKQTEQAIQRSEAEMQAIFSAMTDIVMVFDSEGHYLKIGQNDPKLSYRPTVDLVGKKLHEVFPKSLADYFLDNVRLALEKRQSVRMEYSLKTGNEEHWFAAVVSPMMTDSAVVVARDISESKRAEKALMEREEQYRELFENANDLIYTHDLKGNLTSLNRAGEIITGFTREEALKMNIKQVIELEYLELARRMTCQKIADEAPTTYELEIIAKPGHRVSLELSTRLILQDGKPVGVQGIGRDITERKRAERELQTNEAQLKDLFDNAPTGYHELDREGRIVRVNRTELEMLGYEAEEMLGRFIWEFVVDPISRDAVLEQLSGVKQTDLIERTFRRKDGSTLPVLLEVRLITDESGTITGLRTTVQDITERKRAEESLVNSERRYRSLGEGIMHQVWTARPDGKLDYVNGRAIEYHGSTFERIIGDGWQKAVHPDDLPDCLKRWKYSLETGRDYEAEFRLRRRDGEYRWHKSLATAALDSDGKVGNWFGTNSDINDRKLAEAKLNHNALHDALTNLPNRVKFMNHLKRAISRVERNPAFRFAVLFLDLDRFKVINDSLGHTIGDRLLIAIAERLELCIRPGDIVARLGGDEFTVLLDDINDSADAVRVANRFLEELSAPFKLDSYEVFSSASIGIIISDEVRRQPEDFLRDADTAMYRAKEAGKSRYEIFDREMHIRNMKLLQLENDLRRAIEKDEFRVYYQPIVELETGAIREFEALIRWQHPQHGLVLPNDFIGIAEETGLIIPIGIWILAESCRQTAEWQKSFPQHNLSISVNLSAKQLMHPNLTAQVGEILEKTALNPRGLKLEVTESMVMENSDKALSVIAELHALGISVSTDDFGTGYSSLSYLHRFPFNCLKIDRSFVSKMDTDQKSEAIVRTILLLAQNLNIETVAEGIETERQLVNLRQLGCKTGQGYLFSKPVNAESAARLLRDGLPTEISPSLFSFGDAGE